ncbi:PDZ domain-containing protein [Corynebacterium aquatimens]
MWRTVFAWGVIPVTLGVGLTVLDHVPGTDISLTVPYASEGPGPTFNTLGEVEGTPVIQIEGTDEDPTSGSLDMTTVSVRTGMTFGQFMYIWLTTGDSIVPIEQIMPPNVSEEEMKEMNKQAFLASESAATVAAMRYLGKPTRVVVFEVVDKSAADGVVKPGDTITSVGGEKVSEPTEVQKLIQKRAPGDTVTIGIERSKEDDKEGALERREVEVTLGKNEKDASKAFLGISMTSEPVGDIRVNYNLNDIGGPSAGMMFSLAVIDKLSPGELNGGKNVAGTGTIAENGDVGPIGGIEHKIVGAKNAGAELFLAPSDNCAAAAKAKSGDMVIAKVSTIADAVKAMEDYAAGRDVITCK